MKNFPSLAMLAVTLAVMGTGCGNPSSEIPENMTPQNPLGSATPSGPPTSVPTNAQDGMEAARAHMPGKR